MFNLLGAKERCKTQMDLSIGMFLTSIHNFYEIYSQENSKNYFWIKGNFASLMNLPSQVEKFGPLRCYWDGNNDHFVWIPKNLIEHMRKMESYLISKMTTMHKLNMIRYFQDVIKPPERRDYKNGFRSFQNQDGVIYHLDNKKVLSGFILRDYDNQIHVAYRVGERSILNCILVTFEDKSNCQMECRVNFYSMRVTENDINRVPKSHIMIPYLKMLSCYHI